MQPGASRHPGERAWVHRPARWGAPLDRLRPAGVHLPRGQLGGTSPPRCTSRPSLKALAVAALPLMSAGGSIGQADLRRATRGRSTTGWGRQAAFEATNRYCARDLGPKGCGAISSPAGPIRTRRRSRSPASRQFERVWDDRAPSAGTSTMPSPPPPGRASRCCRTGSPATTGEIVHVDGGVHAMDPVAGLLGAAGCVLMDQPPTTSTPRVRLLDRPNLYFPRLRSRCASAWVPRWPCTPAGTSARHGRRYADPPSGSRRLDLAAPAGRPIASGLRAHGAGRGRRRPRGGPQPDRPRRRRVVVAVPWRHRGRAGWPGAARPLVQGARRPRLRAR